MFEVGELIKRKHLSASSCGHCIVVGKDEDNYTLYNNSTQKLNTVACIVIHNMYVKHS